MVIINGRCLKSAGKSGGFRFKQPFDIYYCKQYSLTRPNIAIFEFSSTVSSTYISGYWLHKGYVQIKSDYMSAVSIF